MILSLRSLALALALLAAVPATPAAAQDFSPVIVVNDRAVTGYELDQRILLLTAFGTPGDVAAEARTQLVEDRLKQQELARFGVSLPEEGLARALEDFAQRAGLTAEEFTARLGQQGVAAETLRDYVAINTTWRDYVRARFGDRIAVTEAEVDQRLAQEATQAQGIEVLLSEIIIPAPPGREAEALALAERVSQIRGEGEFAAAAREVSAVPSRERGGQIDWTPLSNYPPALGQLLLELAPGETTAPLQLTGAVAVLQLRGVRESAVPPAAPEAIDYAELAIPGGPSPAAQAEAARVAARIDTCDDLYPIARERPDLRLARQAVAPAAIPQDAALALAALDPNEVTWGRIGADGSLLLTMLCARTYAAPEGASRDAVRSAIVGDRLTTYADALVADLRAAATIVGE